MWDALNRYVVDTVSKEHPINLTLRSEFSFLNNIDIKATLNKVVIDGSAADWWFNNKDVNTCNINSARQVAFERCRIMRLTLRGGGPGVRLYISNCWIDKFEIGGSSLAELTIKNSGIISVECPAAYGSNPFLGRVTLNKLYLPRHRDEGAINSQRFRDMRAHLNALQNGLAAGVFHGAELALDRNEERWPNSWINWIYEILSDYGNSTSRPLIFFVAVAFGMSWLCAYFDAASIGEDVDTYRAGWHSVLTDPSYGFIWRSVLLALQTIFNPLGIFTTKSLVVAKSIWFSIPFTVAGLIGTISIALFFLALRRRFRLE
jgi:hypothetical protein